MKKAKSIITAVPGVLLVLLLVASAGCKNKGTAKIRETPTSGNVRIAADESFKPIIEAEIDTFTALYNYAQITPIYQPENELIAFFLSDSVKTIASSWTPTDEQRQVLLDLQTVVRSTVVAYDAIALVIHKSNADSLLTYENVKNIFTGMVTDWKQINPASRLGQINIVFDNVRSGNIRYFRELFDLPDELNSNFYAVKTNPEVIDYVSKSPGAIGIVSVNWISDEDDPLSFNMLNKIKVAAVSQPYLDRSSYFLPLQGHIYDKSYPFVREVYMHSRESFSGLGSGFVSFVAGEKGQRIILKSGLVPATMPIRIIQTKMSN
ncbi:MAG: substrate-binding domain-containing protein [Bacteroidales bacterium]|jgi:phosphate transport system substrate-binding protein|nr:substrate-binding domain-containing protein [Bacteroidales bacterium]